MKYLSQLTRIILLPIKRNFTFFFFMYILGTICFLTETYVLNFKIPRFNFLSLIFDTYVLCTFLMIFPDKIRSWFRVIFSIILYVLAIINTFCVEKFYAKIGPEILNVILETNSRESSEFIDKYISFDILNSGVGLIILLIIIHITTAHIWHKKTTCSLIRFNKSRLMEWLQVLGVFMIITSIYFCTISRVKVIKLMGVSNVEDIDKYVSNYSQNTPVNNLLFSIKIRELANKGLSDLINTQKYATVERCEFTSKNIILIIGESYIKCRSQLYGYKKATTPCQIMRSEDFNTGNLIAFSDVITPSNLTSIVFKYIFSLQSADQKSKWSNFPLFPVLFRKAGYKVGFLTNQYAPSLSTDIFNVSGGLFLNNEKLSAAMFNYRNANTHQYDIDLTSDYDSLKNNDSNNNLIIFHLAGQHIDFNKRSPNQFKKFKKTDYSERRDLNDEEKQLVADYDNATLYNDYVVDSIIKCFEEKDAIVIYMPDHGEECFDGLHRIGRIPVRTYKPEIIKQEYSIPFWIWCSKKYIESHPKIFEQIKSASSKPFMTDDIPHMLLYLGGINSNYYDEKRNILSDNYNIKRKRLIMGECDYDKVLSELPQ